MSLDSWTRRTCLALFLIVAGAREWMVSTVDSDLPHWDQWFAEFGAIVAPLGEGTFSTRDLALPHNEHLVLFPRLLSSALLFASSRWEPLDEAIVSAVVRGAVLAFVFALLSRTLPGPGRAVFAVLIAALGALPLGTFNLLSGFQVQFPLGEALTVAALWVLLTDELDIERLAVGVALIVVGLFNTATPLLSSATAGLVCLARWNGVRARRQYGAAALLLLSVAVWTFWSTRHLAVSVGDASGPGIALRTFVRLHSWPFPGIPELALLAFVPLVVFLWRRRRHGFEGDDWMLAALGLLFVVQEAAIAWGRGDTALTFSQYRDGLWLRLVVGFLLLDGSSREDSERRPSRSAWAWAAMVLVAMGVDAARRGAPELVAIQEGSRAASPRLARALDTGDFTGHIAEQYEIARSIARGDISFLADPVDRFAVPGSMIDRLKKAPRNFKDLMPARLAGAAPSFVSRALRRLASAGPLLLATGLALLGVCVRDALRTRRD